MTASYRQQCSAAIAEPATTRATIRPRAASQPGASARNAPTAVQPRSRSHEMTGWHGHDATTTSVETMRSTPRHARSRSAVQVAGRSGERHERGYLRRDERTATPENQSERIDRRRVSQPSWQAAGSRPQKHEHAAHRIGRLDAQHRSTATREASTTAGSPAGDPRRPASRRPGGLAYSTASAQIVQAATRSRVLPRDRRGPLLTPGSALHPRRAQPGRHPGQHPPDHLPGRLDRHDTAARERHRARESSQHGRLRRRRADQLLRI